MFRINKMRNIRARGLKGTRCSTNMMIEIRTRGLDLEDTQDRYTDSYNGYKTKDRRC